MSNNVPVQGTVFVSYAREDRERVRALVNYLSSHFSVWWDDDIEPGSWFRQAIIQQLNEAACVVVVWTTSSVGKQFVSEEANQGLSRGVLVPVVLDSNVTIPIGFREIQYIDLSKWQQTESADPVQSPIFCWPGRKRPLANGSWPGARSWNPWSSNSLPP